MFGIKLGLIQVLINCKKTSYIMNYRYSNIVILLKEIIIFAYV